MGITIRCKKTYRSIDLGTGGFLRLRRKVSELAGEPLSSHYAKLLDKSCFMSEKESKAFYDEFNATTQKLLEEKKIDIKIVDFLLQSDEIGRIRYGACKNILNVIGDYDDDIRYGYCGRRNNTRSSVFKEILRDCVKTKSDMIWD